MTHPYSTVEFGSSLRHIGEPVYLPEWGTMVLVRDCGGGRCDAVGTYPITVFKPNPDLSGGLERLAGLGLVSVVLVVEDSLRPDLAQLRRAFDRVQEFKLHYLHDRTRLENRSKHHRYEVRRVARALRVERFDLAERLDEWCAIYQGLVGRHGLSASIHAFPRCHHATMARLPGAVAIGAFADSQLASCHVWVCNDGHAMSHLAASSERGYAMGAAYAVYDASIQLLPDCRVLNFGGAPGATDDRRAGLARFKRGFANATAPSFLCGKVLDVDAYNQLTQQAGAVTDGDFFPAYRQPGSW